MPTRIVNSKRLNNYYIAFAKPDTKTLITEVLGLYESGNIMNIKTATNILDKLISNNKMTRQKAIKEYSKTQETIKNKQPIKYKYESQFKAKQLTGHFGVQYMLLKKSIF